MKKHMKQAGAVLLSLAMLGGALPFAPGTFSLPEISLTAEAAATNASSVSGDTLTLRGQITSDSLAPFRTMSGIKHIVAEEGTVLPADCTKLFSGGSEDSPEWTDVATIDLSKADTSQVTDMRYMFYSCSSLTSLDLSSFDTSNVTNMRDMFFGCSSLTSIDLSSFDTSKVKDMNSMFVECLALKSLDLSGFDTSNVTNMNDIFGRCEALTSLDLSGFDTSNVTNMGYMFSDCESLTSLDLSSFDTSNVTSMSCMFYDCNALTSLDLSSFDTSNVTDMFCMFAYCYALTTLDLSSFDTSNVTDMSYMFVSGKALQTILVSGLWNTDSVTLSGGMFEDCEVLVGGAGTVFDSTKTDKEYARIDGGTAAPGYFTKSTKYDLSSAAVTLSSNAFAYTGKEIKVGNYITVKSGDTALKYGTDFTMSYANNVNVGYQTASVTITGIGKYSGSVTKKYSILPAKQAAPVLTMLNADGGIHVEWTADTTCEGFQIDYCQDPGFTGDTLHTVYPYASKTSHDLAKYPKPGETWYLRIRAYIRDADGVKRGYWSPVSTITLTGTIDTVTLSKTSFPYTGSAVKCGNYITVKSGDKTLKYGTDFTMSYANNVNVGYQTASVTITGTGAYSGSITKKFTITPAKQAAPVLTGLNADGGIRVAWTPDSSATGFQVLYCQNDSFLSSDPTYHLANYSPRSSCDLAKYPKLGETWYVRVRAYVSGDGTTAGTKYGTWSETASITLTGTIDTVTLSKTVFNYTGSAVKCGNYITVKSGDKTLKYGTDFTMAYANNVNCGVGTASVTITGTGAYTGSITKTFTIAPAKQAAPQLAAVSGGFMVTWTADSNAQFYQVMYCKSSDFSSADASCHLAVYSASKTAATLTKYPEAGETWYVKVRAVLSSDGTSAGTMYGTWSNAASITAG